MAFPDGWPPRPSPGALNIAFYVAGTASTAYSDNAHLFIDGVGANPFQPTPFQIPGDEKEPIQVNDAGPGTPLGTGRDHRDAVPFNPNLFQRGEGLGTADTTFTFAADIVTYYDKTSKFDRGMVGKRIKIDGATSSGNDGTWKILSVVDANTITWENAAGVAEDFPVAGKYRLRLVDDTPPKAAIWSSTIRVVNEGANDIFISFNGKDDHGKVEAGGTKVYRSRAEAGIALRTTVGTSDYYVEAW